MEREIIDSADYLQIAAVKVDGEIKYYELTPLGTEGFYRKSEDKIETGKVYFPGNWDVEDILKDISEVIKE